MDEKTKEILENFMLFLDQNIKQHKHFQTAEIGKYSVHDFKVTIEIFLNQQPHHIYVDLREIKENRFSHLLENAIDQLAEKYNFR